MKQTGHPTIFDLWASSSLGAIIPSEWLQNNFKYWWKSEPLSNCSKYLEAWLVQIRRLDVWSVVFVIERMMKSCQWTTSGLILATILLRYCLPWRKLEKCLICFVVCVGFPARRLLLEPWIFDSRLWYLLICPLFHNKYGAQSPHSPYDWVLKPNSPHDVILLPPLAGSRWLQGHQHLTISIVCWGYRFGECRGNITVRFSPNVPTHRTRANLIAAR